MKYHFTTALINAGHCRQFTKYLPKMCNSYQEAIETLNSLQSNVEYIKRAKIKNNQENNMQEMSKFLARTGLALEQLDELPVIHVAGTNGKGTTCSYCENILRRHGYKTGFYSSPHLLEVRERIRLDGTPISQEKFAKYFWKVYNQLDQYKSAPYDMPLYFRFLTILAFHIFVQEKVDVAIMEVGIGGEYDCTNVVRKTLVAGITPLDIDHTTLLGNTLESIAWNKAGVMKPGCKVFTALQPPEAMKVLQQRSIERQCKLYIIENQYNSDKTSKMPLHVQKTNASLALSISEAFIRQRKHNGVKFNLEIAEKAIEEARWPGRYEIIEKGNLKFFLDGAHTLDSMQVCCDWFRSQTSNNLKVLIFNVTGERQPSSLLKLLQNCHFSTAIFIPNVGHDCDNSDNKDQIQPIGRQLERCYQNKKCWDSLCNGNSEVFQSFSKAINYLENQKCDVLVTGSIHLIGAAMSVLDPSLGGLL